MSEVRACTGCGRVQAYPQPVCRGCGGGDFVLCGLPLAATIFSHTTVFRAPNPELAALVPYAAVLVRAAHGGLLLLPFGSDSPPEIGAAVLVREDGGALVAVPA